MPAWSTMDVTMPDLAVVFETTDGYTITPPPKLHTPLSESPDTSPADTSTDSDNTPPKAKQKNRISRSPTPLPTPVTQQSPRRRIGGPPSFVFGLLLGVLPFLIIVRFLVRRFRKDDGSRLQERWFKYGRSTGIILLLVVIIVLLVELA